MTKAFHKQRIDCAKMFIKSDYVNFGQGSIHVVKRAFVLFMRFHNCVAKLFEFRCFHDMCLGLGQVRLASYYQLCFLENARLWSMCEA